MKSTFKKIGFCIFLSYSVPWEAHEDCGTYSDILGIWYITGLLYQSELFN